MHVPPVALALPLTIFGVSFDPYAFLVFYRVSTHWDIYLGGIYRGHTQRVPKNSIASFHFGRCRAGIL